MDVDFSYHSTLFSLLVPIGADLDLQCGHDDESFHSAVLFPSSIRSFYSPLGAETSQSSFVETCVTIVMIAQAVTTPIVCVCVKRVGRHSLARGAKRDIPWSMNRSGDADAL